MSFLRPLKLKKKIYYQDEDWSLLGKDVENMPLGSFSKYLKIINDLTMIYLIKFNLNPCFTLSSISSFQNVYKSAMLFILHSLYLVTDSIPLYQYATICLIFSILNRPSNSYRLRILMNKIALNCHIQVFK